MRYDYTFVIRNENNKRVYKTTILPFIQPNINDIYIDVDYGDKLDAIAFTYYNQASLWWIIALANNIGKGSIYIQNKMQLRIPSNIDEIKNLLQNSN